MNAQVLLGIVVVLVGLAVVTWLFVLIHKRTRDKQLAGLRKSQIEQFEYHIPGHQFDVYSHPHHLISGIYLQAHPNRDQGGAFICVLTREGTLFKRHRVTVTLRSGRQMPNLVFNGKFVRVPHIGPEMIATIQFEVREDEEPT